MRSKLLIITGSAPCVLEDLARAKELATSYDLLAVGLDAVDKYAEPIKYVSTYHPKEIAEIAERRAGYGNTDYLVISHQEKPGVDICIKDWWIPSGSSSLLGVQAAQRLGYDKIILCGCPLTGKNKDEQDYKNFHSGWQKRLKEISACVRSLSGWTRDLLGAPDDQWIMEAENADRHQ